MNKDKNNFLSTTKGIGIVLMVIGHCGVPWDIDKFIYQFHMPLFFFCSGYFIKNIEDNSSLLNVYKKKIKGLYLKFLIWSMIFLSLHNIFIDLNIYNDAISTWAEYPYSAKQLLNKAVKITFSMNGHEQLIRSFWFFKQLFLASIFVSTIIFFTNKVTNYKHSHLMLLIGLLIMTIISKYYNWAIPAIWDISLVFMSSTYYLSGYIFRKYKILRKLNNTSFSILFFIFLVIGVYTLPWINMLEYTYQTAIPFYIVAFSGTILTLNIAQKLETHRVRLILYYIGQNTMVIFALHMLCFKIGNLLKILIYDFPIYRLAEFQIIADNNTFFWILYTIIGIAIPLLFDYTMKQSKYTRRIWNYFV